MTNPKLDTGTALNKKKYHKKRRSAKYALVKQVLAQQSGLKPVSAQPSAAAAAACSHVPAVATQPTPAVASKPEIAVSTHPAPAAASHPVPAATSAPAPAPAAESLQIPVAECAVGHAAESAPEAAAEFALEAASQHGAHQTDAPHSLPAEAATRIRPTRRRYRKRQDAKARQQAREADEANDVDLPWTAARRYLEKNKQKRKQKLKAAGRAQGNALDPAAKVSGDDVQDQKRQRVAGPAAAAATVAGAGQTADSVTVRVLFTAHELLCPTVRRAQTMLCQLRRQPASQRMHNGVVLWSPLGMLHAMHTACLHHPYWQLHAARKVLGPKYSCCYTACQLAVYPESAVLPPS